MQKKTAQSSAPLNASPPAPSASDAPARTLIHIPIIHTQEDMGALKEAIQQETIRKLGKEGWERNVNLIEDIWDSIEKTIRSWSLPYPKMRVYQDGLPICGRELEIVTDLANAGSRNHRLLLHLHRRGATIMGTESPKLLVQEYQLIKQVLQPRNSKEAKRLKARQKEASEALLKQRDRFIAERIQTTLGPGETGLLFLGMLHSVEDLIARDIRVTQLRCPPVDAKDQSQ